MVEYYESELNPGYYCVSVDGVMVAEWNLFAKRWIDRGVYRPVRSHYKLIEWFGEPYDSSLMFDADQFNVVKILGREAHCSCPFESIESCSWFSSKA